MSSNTVRRGAVYPIADSETLPAGKTRETTRARWTGEVRCPRAGDWYLSGAVVEAYRARADMDMGHHIAELVVGRMVWDA